MVVRTLAFVIVRRVLGVVGLGPRAGCQGHRDRGAPAPADGGAPAGRPAALYAAGPDGVGDVGAVAAAGAVGRLPRHDGDAAALAPRAGGPPLDVPGHRARPARLGSEDHRAGGADGAGNPRWEYLRIVGECRKLGIRVSADQRSQRLLVPGHGLCGAAVAGRSPRRHRDRVGVWMFCHAADCGGGGLATSPPGSAFIRRGGGFRWPASTAGSIGPDACGYPPWPAARRIRCGDLGAATRGAHLRPVRLTGRPRWRSRWGTGGRPAMPHRRRLRLRADCERRAICRRVPRRPNRAADTDHAGWHRRDGGEPGRGARPAGAPYVTAAAVGIVYRVLSCWAIVPTGLLVRVALRSAGRRADPPSPPRSVGGACLITEGACGT